VPDDEDARTYATRKRRLETLTRLKNPLERFVYSPTATLAVTVPLAVLSVGAVVLSGAVDPTVEAFRARRFTATGLLVVLPFLLVTVPIAVFYEIRRRYADRIRKRFPDALSSIARANRSGIGTVEAIKMEAERSGGRVGDELERLHNDIRWFHDPSDAFLRLANRARMQMTVRTMRLLAEANRASGDLHRTLSVAADEARFHKQFAESRAREVATYVAVAIISFLVFLGIILMLQQFYLERIVETGAQTTVAPGGLGVPGSLQSIDAGAFRLIFLHAVLVQGACIGLVTGKLSRGTALAGIKYSIGMVVVSFVLFGVI
jgi:flagellar protein FlaJ